ncbi:alpha/beta hydrolase [Streptomyces otsuchiensis]|uniref:alpha/beta hydrolase n=1 Tax=Streptomyces otsuchiensis TaxID=2681388 RepID=UPI00102FE735|nr:alpha/beta hydrolase [Streptomyces otsuchiensis]
MPATRPFRASAVALTAAAVLLSGCTTTDDAGGGASPSPSDPGFEPTAGLEPIPDDIPEEMLSYYEQELSWRDCGVAGFQCATLTAPLDYGAIDDSEDLQLTVSRKRATGPRDERIGALLVNPGGPGASAIDYLQGHAGVGFPEPVRARYDMVAMDPRGTGRSEPVECLSGPQMDAFTQVDRTPDDEDEEEALVEALTEFGEGCRASSGRLLEHISTEDSARDLDLLRAVLGDTQLHYYGASYGTQLGATYADLFPERSGRLVLDAAVDPRLSTLERDREQAAGFETAFQSFLADCGNQSDCPLDGAADLQELFEELDARPLQTGEDRPLTESLATTGVAQALYSPMLWAPLRDALNAAADGDGAPLLALADSYHDREPAGSYGTIMFAFPAISCLDAPAALEDPDAVREELASFEEASPTFGRDFAWATLMCAAWPVEAKGTPAPVEAAGAADILVVGTTRDPATPYGWSEALAEQLESGVLLTYDGDGHGAYGENACVDEVVGAYLLDGVSPEEGARC